MKFSSTALVATLVFAVADARSWNTDKIQSHLSKVSPEKLLRNARQLDQANQDGGFEITSDYSVKFNECLTLNVLSDQEEGGDQQEDGNNIDHATSIVDYVIVDVISSYDGSVKQFAVDLVTFVTTLANYIPDQMEEYCEACDYDYCYNGGQNDDGANNGDENQDANGDENQDGADEDGEDQEDGGARFLEQNGKIVYTDCDTCSNMSCFNDQNNNGDGDNAENVYSNENALAWLLDVGECQEINEDYYNYQDANGYQLYAGYTCNADGTGMEIGVFADEECSVLTTTTFAEIVENGGYGVSYQSMSSGLVHRVFQQYFDCMNTEYMNPGEDQNNQEDNADEDEDAQFDANDYCQELVQEGVVAMDEACEDENGDGQNNYEYDEDGNPWGQYTDENGDIIYYDIQNDEDAEEVCVAIQSKEGDYTTALEGGSQLYDYSNTKNINNDDKWNLDSGKEGQNDKLSGNGGGNGLWNKTRNKVNNMANEYGFSTAEMWAIVAASFLFGILALLFIIRLCCMDKKKAKLSLDDSDDAVTRSRREPLVNNPEVYVA